MILLDESMWENIVTITERFSKYDQYSGLKSEEYKRHRIIYASALFEDSEMPF